MADHHGFIFVAPNGTYVTESRAMSHAPSNDRHFALNVHLDCAELFPQNLLPGGKVNFGRVRDALKDMGFPGSLEYNLTAIPARSIQRIEIGDFDEV